MSDQRTSDQQALDWLRGCVSTSPDLQARAVAIIESAIEPPPSNQRAAGEPGTQSHEGSGNPPSLARARQIDGGSLSSNPVRDAFYAGWKAAMDADECYIDTADKAWQCYSKADVASGEQPK